MSAAGPKLSATPTTTAWHPDSPATGLSEPAAADYSRGQVATCWHGPGPPGRVRATSRSPSTSTPRSTRPTGWPKRAGPASPTTTSGATTLSYAVAAGTGDVVHVRLRGGNAHSGRGAASFLTETFNRVRTAGATGPIVLRADSGFYSRKRRRRLPPGQRVASPSRPSSTKAV